MDELTKYFRQPENIEPFSNLLGRHANSYVQSVIIAVQGDGQLQKCSMKSIANSALRAASLGLSVDPAVKEAYLVPRTVKGELTACFEPHYRGLYNLAMRTGKYWVINVIPIRMNQDVQMGMDGLHYVYEGDMKIDHFPVSRITAHNIGEVKGWLGYFKTTKGFEKTVYMSVEDIMGHAATHSIPYKNDLKNKTKKSTWSDPVKLPTMQMKTVLRELLNWADLSGEENSNLREALSASRDEEVIDAEAQEIEAEPETESRTTSKTKAVPRLNRTDAEVLQALVDGKKAQNEHEAKQIMLKCRWKTGTLEQFIKWAVVYRGWRDIGLKPTEAAKKTNNGEKPT